MAARMPAVMSDNGGAAFDRRSVRPSPVMLMMPLIACATRSKPRAMPVRAGAAEAGQRAIDQAGVLLAQIVVAEAEPLHRAGREVLDQHVGARRSGAAALSRPPASSGRARSRACCGSSSGTTPTRRRSWAGPTGGCRRRPAIFSILMTSAPMSASISVQVGPAITCVRSTTFSPVNGPVMMNVSPLHLDDGLCTDAGFSPACTRQASARRMRAA